jgi:uncharacterized protein with FMN-binding domain
MNSKKIWGWVIGVVLVVALGIYIIFAETSAAPAVAPNTTDTNPNGSSSTDMMNMSSTMPGMTMTSTTGMTGMYKDGTYTGSTTDAIYGQLQLVVTISGGKITDVTWPIFPNAAGHTSQVSASALPALEQEAIASQSANVNIVSGATQDSEAFQQSLASALAQAQS